MSEVFSVTLTLNTAFADNLLAQAVVCSIARAMSGKHNKIDLDELTMRVTRARESDPEVKKLIDNPAEAIESALDLGVLSDLD